MLLSNEDKTNYVPWGWQEYILLIITIPIIINIFAWFWIVIITTPIAMWLADRIKAPYHIRRRLVWGSAVLGLIFMIIYYLYVFPKYAKKCKWCGTVTELNTFYCQKCNKNF